MNKNLKIYLLILGCVYVVAIAGFLYGGIKYFTNKHDGFSPEKETIQNSNDDMANGIIYAPDGSVYLGEIAPEKPKDQEIVMENSSNGIIYAPDGSIYYDPADETISKKPSTKEIDLSKYNENLVITKSGEYTLTGDFSHSVLIEADGDVTLNLKNVNISPDGIIGPIANNSFHDLFINTVFQSKNTLREGPYSDSEGSISSLGNVIIDGEGTLNIFGNQHGIYAYEQNISIYNGYINIESKQDGLSTGTHHGGIIDIHDGNIFIKSISGDDSGINNLIVRGGNVYVENSFMEGKNDVVIHKGSSVIMLGSKKAQVPNVLKQGLLKFDLNKTQKEKELYTILLKDKTPVYSFIPDTDFDTIIITYPTIETALYSLYIGGKNTGYKNENLYITGDYIKGQEIDKVYVGSPSK